MKHTRVKRQTSSAVDEGIDTNIRCCRIYPTENTKRTIDNLKTVGFKLTREQAIHLAQVLLTVTEKWDEVDVTAYRLKRRKKDGTYQVTITSQVEIEDGSNSRAESEAVEG